ncbi:MAG: VOC family protein [Caldilineaceae bacterium]
MKLEHVAINVPEPAAMAAWYAEHLGMRIVVASKESPYMHFIADDAGSMVELYNNPAAALPDYANMSPYNLHLAFSSTNIEADRDRMVAAGATLIGDVSATARGDKLLFLRDPWNVPFQFVQRSSPLL